MTFETCPRCHCLPKIVQTGNVFKVDCTCKLYAGVVTQLAQCPREEIEAELAKFWNARVSSLRKDLALPLTGGVVRMGLTNDS